MKYSVILLINALYLASCTESSVHRESSTNKIKEINAEKVCVDVDSNKYNTSQIGDNIWMMDNLAVSQFNDGTPIEIVSDEFISEPAMPIIRTVISRPAMRIVRTEDGKVYHTYNYYAIMSNKGLAPKGWRIANEMDWQSIDSPKSLTLEETPLDVDLDDSVDGPVWWSATLLKRDSTFAHTRDKDLIDHSFTKDQGRMYKFYLVRCVKSKL